MASVWGVMSDMVANAKDYPGGQIPKDIKLAALGFDNRGHRGGGIDAPILVHIPQNAMLMRLYKPKSTPDEKLGDFGSWWFTPHELSRLCKYFGIDTRPLTQGRSAGTSALHGAFALLHEWYGNSPHQLSYLNVVHTSQPLLACYGAGAPGNTSADSSNNVPAYKRTLKPIRLDGNTPARQLYIHTCWDYQDAMVRIVPQFTLTETVFSEKRLLHFLSDQTLGFER